MRLAVIVPALKFPDASRATIADAVFADAAVVALFDTFPAVAIVDNAESAIAVNPVPIAPDVNVPTDVRLDATTVAFSPVPVSVPAAAVTVIFADPLNDVPLIVRAVCNVVAVDAFPVNAPENVVAEMMRPAKSPLRSRATTFDAVFAESASTANVAATDPS